MSAFPTISELMADRELTFEELTAATKLDAKVVRAIIDQQYTPSPKQRERLASALSVGIAEVQWGHSVPVDHMYGHGPQFGRSP